MSVARPMPRCGRSSTTFASALLGAGRECASRAVHRLDDVGDRGGRVHVGGDVRHLDAVHLLVALGLHVLEPGARDSRSSFGALLRRAACPCARALTIFDQAACGHRVADVPAREPGAVTGRDEAAAAVEARHVDAHLDVGLRHLFGPVDSNGAGRADAVLLAARRERELAVEARAVERVRAERCARAPGSGPACASAAPTGPAEPASAARTGRPRASCRSALRAFGTAKTVAPRSATPRRARRKGREIAIASHIGRRPPSV